MALVLAHARTLRHLLLEERHLGKEWRHHMGGHVGKPRRHGRHLLVARILIGLALLLLRLEPRPRRLRECSVAPNQNENDMHSFMVV